MVQNYWGEDVRNQRKADKVEKVRQKEEQRQIELANPSARFAPTQVTYTDTTFAHPPPLEYTLRTRWKSISIFWTLVFLDVVCMPIVLYFCLWYLTHLSHNAVFSISTGALGTVSIVEYFLRFHNLWKNGSTCRVIGARRWYLDFFHWNLSIGWTGVMLELIMQALAKRLVV